MVAGLENGIWNAGYQKEAEATQVEEQRPQMTMTRPIYDQSELNMEMNYRKPKKKVTEEVLNTVKSVSLTDCIKSVFPIFAWLPEYRWKSYFTADLLSGWTVGLMQLPQGMGFAMLAYLPPIIGIYMAFFPVLVYFLLGTSRHNSMGTFAVMSVVIGKIILEYSTAGIGTPGNVTGNSTLVPTFGGYIVAREPIEVAVTLSFAIITVLGLHLPPVVGAFKIFRTFALIFADFHNINYISVSIALSTISILAFNNVYLKEKVAKYSKVPIPVELIILVIGSLMSSHFRLHQDHGIKTIEHMPTGFPPPTVPDWDLLQSMALEGFIVAIVSYAASVSMGTIYAQREKYELDFNQELLAMGTCNLFGSFFSCMPIGSSLLRSAAQCMTGGKSQLASIISCCLIAAILLYVGPFFEPLPACILCGIVLTGMRRLLLQVTQFIDFWKLSTIDGMVWLGTFLTVVFVSIDIGLLVGIGLSFSSIFLRGLKSYTCLLENVPDTDLYLDSSRYNGTLSVPGVKIFHYSGSLNFVTRSVYKTSLCKALNITQELTKHGSHEDDRHPDLRYLVLDCTRITDIDPSAVFTLQLLINELEHLAINVLIAGTSCSVYSAMQKCELIGTEDCHIDVFPTVHDAVIWAKSCMARYPVRVSVEVTRF
ncbi:prestin-like [Sabethes cyaneus]|uniref:prestin-like n=1 Tax=Sabethes cyaneus TaxID=53552 RepID=UPI00237ECACB|nr:prestin-like [Sabethes cyaneus]